MSQRMENENKKSPTKNGNLWQMSENNLKAGQKNSGKRKTWRYLRKANIDIFQPWHSIVDYTPTSNIPNQT